MTVPVVHRRLVLHGNGPALWPEHKPLAEVLRLQATTPPLVWSATYQGAPTAPGGATFKRRWFRDNRYDPTDTRIHIGAVGRWLSFDTAGTEGEASAYTAACCGELTPEYKLPIREVWRDRLTFPDLTDAIPEIAAKHNRDGKLQAVIVEDKATGTSLLQTLAESGPEWLKPLLEGFTPTTSKEERAGQAATWCKNGSVLLPRPDAAVPWLFPFEDELFNFPNGEANDQVDAFSQLVLWLEHLLADGYHARLAATHLQEPPPR